MHKLLLIGALLFGLSGSIHAQKLDTTRVKSLKEATIESKRLLPVKPTEIEAISLLSGKKNEVIRLANIDANLTTNNSRQIFSRVPGISIWENDGSGVQVSIGARGLSPNRSWEFNTRQNGYDISSDVFGYPEAYYNPPMEAVDRIQIVRGGGSLQYGSQFGGLINYQLKRIVENKPFTLQSQNTVGSYSMFSSFNALGGNTAKWNYYVYNHYRKGNSWRQNGQYDVRNTHAFLQYKINTKNSISVEHTNMDYELQQSGGLTDAQFASNHQQSFRNRNWFSTPWNLGAINFDTKVNENLSFNLKIFGLIGERNSIGFVAAANVLDTFNTTLNDFNNRQVDRDFYKNIGSELRGLYSYNLLKMKQSLAFGARIYQANTTRKQKGKGDSGFDYNTTILTDKYPTELLFTTNNFAFFVENQFNITDNFSVTAGVRYENIFSDMKGRLFISGTNEVNAIPISTQRNVILGGLGMEYKLKNSNIYTNFSQAFRPVLFSDITPPATSDIIDVNLKDANGFNLDLGYRGALPKILTFDISAFYIQYNDRIGSILRYLDNDPAKATYQFRTNLGKSSNKGVEAYVDFNLFELVKLNPKKGKLSLFASLAFINATYDDFKTTSIFGAAPNIIIKEVNLKGNKVENAPSQIHSIGVTYSFKGFSTTLQTRITSEVFTDATNTEAANSAATIGKIAGYQVYDLSAEYVLLNNYNIKFSINNLTNTKYATRRAGGYPGPGLMPGEGRSINLGLGIKL